MRRVHALHTTAHSREHALRDGGSPPEASGYVLAPARTVHTDKRLGDFSGRAWHFLLLPALTTPMHSNSVQAFVACEGSSLHRHFVRCFPPLAFIAGSDWRKDERHPRTKRPKQSCSSSTSGGRRRTPLKMPSPKPMLMDLDLWTGALRADIWKSLLSVSGKD